MKFTILNRFLSAATFSLLAFQIVLGQCPSSPGANCDGSGGSLNLYWVGTDASDNGDWSSPCSWRVGSISGVEPCQAPRSHDNVFFVVAGFDGASASEIRINTQARCNNLYVDPNINGLTNGPSFELSNPGFLEIYGSFTLQTNMSWNTVNGFESGSEIFFKATTAGQTIQCAGHTLGSVQFDGIGGVWRLQDHFRAGCMLFAFGYLNTSDGSTSHDMTIQTFDSDVRTGGDSTNRRWDLNESTIHLIGSSDYDRYEYSNAEAPHAAWECGGTAKADFSFNAMESTIQVEYDGSFFGRLGGLHYGTIRQTTVNVFQDHIGPTGSLIDTLELDGYNFSQHPRRINVLKINTPGLTHSWYDSDTISRDVVIPVFTCTPTTFKSDNDQTLFVEDTASADTLVGLSILGLQCDNGAGGFTIIGYNSLDAAGWNVIEPDGRELYWTGITSSDWNDPTNWATDSAGTNALDPTDCPPTQVDNVLFMPSANGMHCFVGGGGGGGGACNNLVWAVTAPTNFEDGSGIDVYGNLDLDSFMVGTWRFNCLGDSGNTIRTNGQHIDYLLIGKDADYTLQDSLSVGSFYVYNGCSFKSDGNNMSIEHQLAHYYSSTFDISGSTVWMSHTRPLHYYGQLPWTIDGNSHLIFTGSGEIETRMTTIGYDNRFPHFTLQNPDATLRIDASSKGSVINFQGNVTLNGSARFYADMNPGNRSAGNLTKLAFHGDLNLAAGELYEFGVSQPIIVAGDVNAVGTCSTMVSIMGANGNPYQMAINGNFNGDYTLIMGLESTNTHSVTNSADLGGNANLNFVPNVGRKFYWRSANGSDNSIYDGDWSVQGNWTTVPTNTEGEMGCIPSFADTVIFDGLSYSGQAANINLGARVSCAHIEGLNTNINLLDSGELSVLGGVDSDGSLKFKDFRGQLMFSSSDTATIDVGGDSLGCDIKFINPDANYTLESSLLSTKDIYFQAGILNTANHDVAARRFISSTSNPRTLNLGESTMTFTDNGKFVNIGNLTNEFVWDTENTENFNFNADSATINFSGDEVPVVRGGKLSFGYVNFTNVGTADAVAPVIIGDSAHFVYLRFDGCGKLYGNNSYDTLEFTPGNVYRLKEGTTHTLTAPDGVLLATGSGGSEIAIKSITTGIPATLYKDNTGGSMTSFCLDYLSIEDNKATSNDPVFRFFTGINSNDISATGIWDFSRSIFITPTVTAGPDQNLCNALNATVSWDLLGSGPYILSYSANSGPSTKVVIPHGETNYSITVSPDSTTKYTVTSFEGDNCSVLVPGVQIDGEQWVHAPSAQELSKNGDTSSCSLSNEEEYIDFHESILGTSRPILSMWDSATGSGLGNITTSVRIDDTVSLRNGKPYLQRRFTIDADNNQDAKIRFYFSKAELDALSNEFGDSLTLANLSVSLFSANDYTLVGDGVNRPVIEFGNIPVGITTTDNVYYLEIRDKSFAQYVIHGPDFWNTTDVKSSMPRLTNVRLYPNPSNGNFSVQLFGKEKQNYELQLYSVVGKLITKQTLDGGNGITQVSIEDQPEGVYLVRIMDRDSNSAVFQDRLINRK